jgi:hypothetical protein
MEKYIKKRINKELIKKKFEDWNKNTILFLIFIYKNSIYSKFYDINLLLLEDYIKWYKKNGTIQDMYSFDKLTGLYLYIKEDLFYSKNNDYSYFLNNEKISNSLMDDIYSYFINNNFCSLSFGLMITISYIIIKYFYLLLFSIKVDDKKVDEIKLPSFENILNNPIIKKLLSEKF